MRGIILGLALLLPLPLPAQDGPPAAPCAGPEHRQFDFWLGHWQVTNAETGEIAGENTISKALGDCVLHERWRGAGGMTGESFNAYSRHSGQWHQAWVDSNGGRLVLSGGLDGDAMVLAGAMPHAEHGMVEHRITWTPLPAGDVRQHWQISTDGGDAWQTLFDGLYQKSE